MSVSAPLRRGRFALELCDPSHAEHRPTDRFRPSRLGWSIRTAGRPRIRHSERCRGLPAVVQRSRPFQPLSVIQRRTAPMDS